MTDDNHRQASRRKFLTFVGIGGVAVTGLAGAGAIGRYLFPAVLYEPNLKTKVGRPEEFSVGTTAFLPDSKIFVKSGPEGFSAISATCTHLGCVVTSTDTGFECPCHGSVFNETGNVMSGPAPRPLPWFEVSMSPGGQLVVDRSRSVPPGTQFKA